MIPHKAHWFGLAGLATACLGLVTALFRVSPLWPTVVAAGCAALVVWFARHAVHGADLFAKWPQDARRAAVRWIAVAAVADVAAVGALDGLGIRRWLAWLTAVTALTAAQVGAAHVLELLWLRLKPNAAARAASTEVAVIPPAPLVPDHERAVVRSRTFAQMSHDERVLHDVLTEIGYGWLVMCGYEEIRDQVKVFGAAFLVRVPASRVASMGDKAVLPASAGEPIAIALGERLGLALPSQFVAIRKQDRVAAGLYRITVVTEDVMARIYPYRDPQARQSISQPALVGYGIDTKPVYLPLTQHGQSIGMTRFGKTSLIHTYLAYATLCAGNAVENENCVVFVCGTEKLYDMIGSWLKVYQDTGVDMPFEWVAHGPEDTGLMLIGLMAAARYRQSVEHQDRSWPTIICILDEASFALRNKTVIGYWDGQPVTMTDMAANIGQGAGSANCWLQYATQRDTNDQLGDRGGDLSAQAGFTAAFNSADFAAIGRTMGDYKLPVPGHKGEFWLKNGAGDEPQLVKSTYIQEIDPTKPRLHDGATIADVSWARRHFPRRLDEGTADAITEAVGAVFTRRARKVTSELIAYLRGVNATGGTTVPAPTGDASPRPAPPVQDALPVDVVCDLAEAHGIPVAEMSHFQRVGFAQAVAAEFGTVEAFEAFLANPSTRPAAGPVEDAVPGPPVAPTPAGPAPAAIPRIPRVDAMVQVVADAAGPLRSGDILAALRHAGYVWDDDVACYNQLAKLVASGRLAKDGRLYTVPGRKYAHAGDAP